ncbi:MAG: glycoside hydrolase domain-containing protein [Victivallaceae bacterium]
MVLKFNKLLIGLIIMIETVSAFAADKVEFQVSKGKHGKELNIETPYYNCIIWPEKGARITSLKLKSSNRDLVCSANKDGGIGKDIEISQGYPGEMLSATYKYEIIETSPKTLSIKFSFDKGGNKSVLKDIILEKTYTFSALTPLIKADIFLRNKGVSRVFGYRVHNAGLMINENDRIFLPYEESTAIKGVPISGGGLIEKFKEDWAGFYDTKLNSGIIFKADYEQLDKFLWLVKRRKQIVANIEWYYKKFNFKKNTTWTTSYFIIPLNNIHSIPVYVDRNIIVYKQKSGNKYSLEFFGLGKSGTLNISGFMDNSSEPFFSLKANEEYGSLQKIALTPILNNETLKITLASAQKTKSFLVALTEDITFEQEDDIIALTKAKEMHSKHIILKKRFKDITNRKVPDQLKTYFEAFAKEISTKKENLDLNYLEKINNSIASLYNQYTFPNFHYILWACTPYSGFSCYDLPTAYQPLKQLKVSMAGNEYESLAFMITNTSDQNETFQITVPPILDTKGKELGKLTVRYAYFVLSAGKQKMFPSVLPSVAGTDNQFTIPKGQTGQVWLVIKTNKEISSGLYTYPITVEPVNKDIPKKTVSLKLSILPFSLPGKLNIDTCTYAYLVPPKADKCRGHLWGVKDKAVDDLKAHYETHCVTHPYYMPVPKVKKRNGKYIVEVDFSRFDQALELHKNARFYLFLWGGGLRYFKNFGGTGYAYPGAEWKKLFSCWLKQWIEHIKEKGIGYDKFAMYPLDEKPAEKLAIAGKAIKEVDPNVKVYATLGFSYYTLEGLKKIAPYVDMMCISTIAKGEKLDFLKKAGKHIWPENQPNPSKALSPYAMRWTMWKWYDMGLNGCEAWAYNHASGPGSLWNDFDGICHDENFVYDGAGAPFKTTEAIVPSKQWEAWREGIQDWQYLKILEQLIKEGCARGVDKSLLKNSEYILREQVSEVLNNPNDVSMAQKAKEKIILQIIELKKVNKK